MTTLHDPTVLPADIPAPQDDGAARHLTGTRLPSLPLAATDGSQVDLSKLAGRTVVYIYPRTGVPGQPLPDGWNQIPGARGCTPQSCGFRDHFAELRRVNAELWDVEDAIRECDARDDFGQSFIDLARAVYRLNDERSRLKKAINLASGSRLVEEKSYSFYHSKGGDHP